MPSPADVALKKKTEWLNALEAIADGYPMRVEVDDDDKYIIVENPYYREEWGGNPNLVIQISHIRAIVRALGG